MQCIIWNLASEGLHLALFQEQFFFYNYLRQLKLGDFILLDFGFYENAAAYCFTMGPKERQKSEEDRSSH